VKLFVHILLIAWMAILSNAHAEQYTFDIAAPLDRDISQSQLELGARHIAEIMAIEKEPSYIITKAGIQNADIIDVEAILYANVVTSKVTAYKNTGRGHVISIEVDIDSAELKTEIAHFMSPPNANEQILSEEDRLKRKAWITMLHVIFQCYKRCDRAYKKMRMIIPDYKEIDLAGAVKIIEKVLAEDKAKLVTKIQ